MIISWKQYIDKVLKKNNEFHQQKGEQENDIPFWAVQFELDSHQLDAALENVALNIFGKGPNLNDWVTIYILLYLVRSRLKNVSANYIWPEVAREINRVAEVNISSSRCGFYFRKKLIKKYKSELIRKNSSFPYVALILSQAGVGKDRKRILTEYFTYLVEAIQNTKNQPLTTKIAFECYDLLPQGHTDVEVLADVLLHSGKLLVNLITALRSRINPVELTLWCWEDLVNFWYHETGGKLELVLPEAKELFSKIINQLPAVITRGQMASYLTDTYYNVTGPGINAGMSVQEFAIPLTTVVFEHNNIKRRVTISDNSGYTADTISALPEKEWHVCKNNHLIYRDRKQFNVSLQKGNVVTAAAYIKNNHTQPDGYFWSGTNLEFRPCVVENHLFAPALISIRPDMTWSVTNYRVSFQINSISVNNGPRFEYCVLHVNNRTIWEGQLRSEYFLTDLSEHGSLISVFDDVTVGLNFKDGKNYVTTVHFPFRREPFILFDIENSAIKEREWLQNKDDIESIFLVTIADEIVHFNSGCRYKKIQVNKGIFSGKHYDIYHLLLENSTTDDLVIYINDKIWFCGKNIGPSFVRPAHQVVKIHDISISGTGLIFPLTDDLEINIPSFQFCADGTLPSWYLVIGSKSSGQGVELNQIAKLDSMRTCAKNCVRISIDELIQIEADSSGLLFMQLVDNNGFSADSIIVLPLTGNFVIEPCQIGHRSKIQLLNKEQKIYRVFKSDRAISIFDTETTHRYQGENSALLEIKWPPLQSDILMIENDLVVDGAEEIIITQNRIIEFCIKGSNCECKVVCNNQFIFIKNNGRLALLEILNQLEVDSSVLPCKVRATTGKIIKEWIISIVPKIHHFESEWSENNGNSLDIFFNCFCLKKTNISVSCEINNDKIIETSATCSEYLNAIFEFQGKATLNIPEWYSGSDIVVEISTSGHLLFRKNLSFRCNLEKQGPDYIKNRIYSLTRFETKRTMKLELLEFEILSLIGKYYAIVGRYPFPLRNLTDAINRLAQHQNENMALLCDGLLLYEKLDSQQSGFPGEINLRKDPAAIFLNSLKLVLELRRYKFGLARPEFFVKFVDYCESLTPNYIGTIFFSWLSFMKNYVVNFILKKDTQNVFSDHIQIPEDLREFSIFQYDVFM